MSSRIFDVTLCSEEEQSCECAMDAHMLQQFEDMGYSEPEVSDQK